MNMRNMLDSMQGLADKLADISSQLEDGTSLLGEWKDLADKHEPDDITGFIEKVGEWEAVENEHGDASEVEDKLEKLEGWECIESLYGLSAGEVEEKLDELSEWEDVSNWHGSPEEVKSRLEEGDDWAELETEFGSIDTIRSILKEHGTATKEDMKKLLTEYGTQVEELEAVVTTLGEDCDEMYEKYTAALGGLEALKNRTRWQVFLSLFTGRN